MNLSSMLPDLPRIDVLSVFAVLFGIVWIVVNIYMFYPLIRSWVLRWIRSHQRIHVTDATLTEQTDLSTIDLLIPAYKEGEVIDQAVSSVRNAEYPQENVNLIVLTEPGDSDTRDALEDIDTEYQFTTIVVPDEYPGDPNKPRALNFGFELTEGDIVGVIDAENEIAPGLFAKVNKAITEKGCDYTQGRVDMVNEQDGWLNTLFRAEYGYWYNYIIPAHFSAGYPIPLSGTTCFFARDVMYDISEFRIQKYGRPWSTQEQDWFSDNRPEQYLPDNRPTREPVRSDGSGNVEFDGYAPWNPKNVTEDFELGLSLWTQGYELGLVKSITTEESPLETDPWIKQRTRWQKGKLQTFLQYLHQPPRTISAKFHVLWQSVLPHLGPINVLGVIFLLIIANLIPWSPGTYATILLTIATLFIPIVALVHVYGYWTTSDAPVHLRMLRACIVFAALPVYWLLQWTADVRALKQIYVGDLHWEKTSHLGQNDDLAPDGDIVDRLVAIVYHSRLLIPVLAVGMFLRVFRLGFRSYWLDEIYSVVYRGSMPVQQILTMTQESHPPLYYVFLHYWMQFFGTSPTATRLLSAIFGMGAIIAIYFFAMELFNREAGLIAAILLAVSTFHVHQSRTTRMYELLVLLAIVSTYFFWRMIRERSYSMTLWYIVSTWLLVLTHLFAVFVVIAQNFYVITLWLKTRNTSHSPSLRYWFSIQTITGLLAVPWIILLSDRVLQVATGSGESNIGWIQPPSLSYLIETFLVYFGHPNYYPIMAGTSLTTAVAICVIWLTVLVSLITIVSVQINPIESRVNVQVPDMREKYLLFVLFVTSVGVPFVLSYLIVPVYVIRNTIIGSVAIYLFIAGSLVRLRSKHLRYVVVGMFVISGIITGATYMHADTEEQWEQVIDRIETNATSSDLVILHPSWINTTFKYYSTHEGYTVMDIPRGETVHISDNSIRPRRLAETDTGVRTDTGVSNRSQSRLPTKIWVLNYAGGSINSEPLLSVLHQSRYHAEKYARYGIIEIYVFVLSERTKDTENITRLTKTKRRDHPAQTPRQFSTVAI
jgi:cellulose synthase/poly-beta-1,6-N-acetylglucosamine synthase-like glycosyltransferase/uncharacterized membrane protein